MANDELINQIKQQLSQNKSKEEIYETLLNQGWKVKDIQRGFNQLKSQKDTAVKKEKTQKRAVRVILIIGAVLIGAGFFSFIAANWQEMARGIRITIILLAMLGFYYVGWTAKEKYQYEKTGSALILLGAIIYGVGIFLVGQMYHTSANWPDGFILWMLGVIAVALALKMRFLFSLAIPLGFIAILGYPNILLSFIGFKPVLLTSTLLLVIATIVSFFCGWTYRKKVTSKT